VSVSDVMILSQVWQRLMLLSMQPMAWVPLPPQDDAPVKSSTRRRRQRARRK